MEVEGSCSFYTSQSPFLVMRPGALQVVLEVKRHGTQIRSLDPEDPPKEEMKTHSSILAWRIPRTEEPGGLQSIGSQRVRHNWSNLAGLHALLNKQKLWFCDACPFEHTAAAPAHGIWWINAPDSPSFCGAILKYVLQASSKGLNCSGPWQWCVH